MFIINKVIKEKDNSIAATNVLGHDKEDAHKKLHETVEDIINKYGMCKNTNYLKDSIHFIYEDNVMVHIFIQEVEIPYPRVIIELEKGVIKTVNATKGVELIAMDYYIDGKESKVDSE